jgi:hypothetical protein
MGDYRGCIIADLTESHGNRKHAMEEVEANAKLIVAAKDMLEALMAVNNYFIALQNKCALTVSDERAWKLTAKAINLATEG